MEHARALCAITNPSVNSYKRLLSGYDAPYLITWADKGEKALVNINREIDDVKIELRFPDGSANPYLVFAACLAAGLDGIEKKTAPGPEYSSADAQNAKTLPEDLKEAVMELEKDDVVIKALGEEFVKVYTKVKRDEWRSFVSEVTQWEIDNYLTRI